MCNFMHKRLPYISSKKFYKTYNLLRKYEMFVITQNIMFLRVIMLRYKVT